MDLMVQKYSWQGKISNKLMILGSDRKKQQYSIDQWKKAMSDFFQLGFTPCRAEQPLQGMELQEEEMQKD